MRHFFTLSVIALAALLGSCGDTSTTPNVTTGGEIYGQVNLFNEYRIPLTDNSGVTAELLVEGKVIQRVTTAADGKFTFKNVQAGVYDYLIFKQNFASSYAPYGSPYGIRDSIVGKNFQFVGQGRFPLVASYGLTSILIPDSTYWALKPTIRYEEIKDIKAVNDIWIKDTVIPDTVHPHSHSGTVITTWGSGTKETRKIRFIIDYERTLPFPEMKRTVEIFNKDYTYYTITSDANTLSGVYEYSSPNIIVRDSTGRIVNDAGRGGSCSDVRIKEMTLQASSSIPNDIRKLNNAPRRTSKTNELKVSLTD